MNIKAISRNVGYALLVSALFMFLSILVSFYNGNDSAGAALIISFAITFIVGIFPFIFVKKTSAISLKDGYVIIVLSWLLSFIFGMLPYALWGGPFTLANAWFESVSGFTTTGATILDNVESVPRSLLFWRSSTHFIGGLGVVVFLLLIIPNTSQIRLRLTNMELSSLSREGYNARANRTVYIFAYVYLGLAVLAFLSYWAAGMNFFDALCHAFSVCATGGFSTRSLSIAAFDSTLIEAITLVFMFLGSIHFGLLYIVVIRRSLGLFINNTVVRNYVVMLLCFTLCCALSLRMAGNTQGFGRTLWESLFQVVATASTTGFAIADTSSWGIGNQFFVFLLALICGCAGSTTGGLKIDRIILLLKSIGKQVRQILHPTSVYEIRIGTNRVKNEDVYPHLLYIGLYFLVLALSVVLCSASGMNMHSCLSASVSSLGNVGPAVMELGPMSSFNAISNLSKFILTIDMFLGRVEIYPVLAVLGMMFTKTRR